MAYGHYWKRILEFERESFARAAEEVGSVLSRARDMGIRIAGPTGEGKPEINGETIAFNGAARCGHRYRDLGKEPYASPTASGVEEREPPYDAKADPWFAGPLLDTRVCNGSCAGEAFVIDRKYLVRDWERPESDGMYRGGCDTHFKPYDLVVTAALIRIVECLGRGIIVSSENPDHGFDDAKKFCRELFGWPSRFEVHTPEPEIVR